MESPTNKVTLAGLGEIAARFGVSKQRVSQLQKRPDFPAPLARLAAGPVWDMQDIEAWSSTWNRKRGRPKKT